MAVSKFIKQMMIARQIQFDEGRFELLGIRGLILPVHTFVSFVEEAYKETGDTAFDMLFAAGKAHGSLAAEQLGEKHSIPAREMFSKMMDSANLMGIGYLEVQKLDIDAGEFVLTIEDSPFVEAFADSPVLQDVDRNVDEFHRGLYHTLAGSVFDGDVESSEEQCAFHGAERCIIRVSTANDTSHGGGAGEH